ncbi:MAG TPA: hypothetical protein VJG32_01015 [Anaerolineae bacterium]|nr:hypothetical protein [Anaerolineae bacterium]
MRGLLLLVLLALIVYALYANGTLSNVIPSVPAPGGTPTISVTVISPPRGEFGPTPTQPGAAPTVIFDVPTATAVPIQPTVPPPTIIIPEPPPTLPIDPTPTPASNFPLTIETPRDGETVYTSPYLVIGQTQPDALVSVNDVVGFANAEGRFSLSAPLQPGVNVLEVLASNAAGEQVFVILTIVYQP